MEDKPLSFEEIDKHIHALDLAKFRTRAAAAPPHGREMRGSHGAKASPADAMGRVCTIYRGVRPIIVSVTLAWFLPKKWRQAMEAFVGVMDGLCSVEPYSPIMPK